METSGNFLRRHIAMTYNEILEYLRKEKIKTKSGNDIQSIDLRKAIVVMEKKHSGCRWKVEKLKGKYKFILYEGVLWIKDVYFNMEGIEQMEADLQWFEKRIKWYQDQFNKKGINYPDFDIKNLPQEIKEAEKFFDRSNSLICRYIKQLNVPKEDKNNLSKEEVKWLLRYKFKQKYVECLEEYKMQLTEIFIREGGIYDKFFFN